MNKSEMVIDSDTYLPAVVRETSVAVERVKRECLCEGVEI